MGAGRDSPPSRPEAVADATVAWRERLSLAALLIPITFAALTAALARADRGRLAEAALRAAVLLGISVALLTEMLSALGALAYGPVVATWSLMAFAAVLAVLGTSRNAACPPWPRLPQAPADRRALLVVALVLLVCLATALLAPPNNYDAMTYHLPRVRHWIQNRSLEHYPTHNLRQISFPRGAAYLVTHVYLLAGGDRLVNAVQWSAFLGCVVAAGILAGRLAGRRSRWPAVLACASIPMAVLQSTTPQTDLVASFWLACFAWLVLCRPRHRPRDQAWLAAALGLAVVTKPTVALFAMPLFALLVVRALRRGLGTALAVATVVAAVAALPSLPGALSNLRTFGTPLGTDTGTRNTRLSPTVTLSNLLRNAALSCPWRSLWTGVRAAHSLLGIDPDDPASTFRPSSLFAPEYADQLLNPDENIAASPLHVLLGLVAGLTALRLARRRRRPLAALALCLAAGFVLHCTLLRWQPWGNRLLLPLLVLASPLVGWGLVAWPRLAAAMLRPALAVIGPLYALTPIHHPLVALPESWTYSTQSASILTLSRQEIYFSSNHKELRDPYHDVLSRAARDGCARLGLVLGPDDWEYPIWTILDATGLPVKIQHVAVRNLSLRAPPEFPDAELCGLFLLRPGEITYRPLPVTARPAPAR